MMTIQYFPQESYSSGRRWLNPATLVGPNTLSIAREVKHVGVLDRRINSIRKDLGRYRLDSELESRLHNSLVICYDDPAVRK